MPDKRVRSETGILAPGKESAGVRGEKIARSKELPNETEPLLLPGGGTLNVLHGKRQKHPL